MSTCTHILNVTETEFNELVIEKSYKVPVFVDFWADWCQPCKLLIPLLEKLAQEYDGKFILAKVNSDENKSLSTQFEVRSIPTVKVFKKGKIIDSFMGMQPEPVIRKIIDTHIESESELISSQGLAAIQQGDVQGALELLHTAVDMEPTRASLKLNLAKGYVANGNAEKAVEIVTALSFELRNSMEAGKVLAMIKFIKTIEESPCEDELELRLAHNPDDLKSRYQLGAHKILADDNESGLKHFLEIMQRDRKYCDDIGHSSILATFKLLGVDHELVKQYRRKLAMLLH